MLDGLADGDLQNVLQLASLRPTVRETLSDTVTTSRETIEEVRRRLELCNDPASLDKLWRETERLVEAEAGKVVDSFRELQADPAMKNVKDKMESEDKEWTKCTINEFFCIDALRLEPVTFCCQIEGFLKKIALTLK